jgi:tRNA pseudouridine55 synthase
VILLGKATRLFDLLTAEAKEYEGTIVLGESRDTQDAAGAVVEMRDAALVRERATLKKIEEIRQSFLGEQTQTAPLYSALKHKGKPLYYYARRQIAVEPKQRKVIFYFLELTVTAPAEISFKSRVSKGTYLRSLAHDFGVRLGTLGYLGSLRRTRSGGFSLDQAHSLDEILKMPLEDLRKILLPLESVCHSREGGDPIVADKKL